MKKHIQIKTIQLSYKHQSSSRQNNQARKISKGIQFKRMSTSYDSKQGSPTTFKRSNKDSKIRYNQQQNNKQDLNISISHKTQYPKSLPIKRQKHLRLSRQQSRKLKEQDLNCQQNQRQRQRLKSMLQVKKFRLNSQPVTNVQSPVNYSDSKNEMVDRISKKLQFMRKMTDDDSNEQPMIKIIGQKNSTPTTFFKFDKLYEHCMKKLKKGVILYEKNITKSKDKKYYELKTQTTLLSKQLNQIRFSLQSKKNEQNKYMGVVGNIMPISKQRCKTARTIQKCETCCNGKPKLIKHVKHNVQRNCFLQNNFSGWQFGIQKNQQFYL